MERARLSSPLSGQPPMCVFTQPSQFNMSIALLHSTLSALNLETGVPYSDLEASVSYLERLSCLGVLFRHWVFLIKV